MNPADTAQQGPTLLVRASDDERERVVDELRQHCAAGRLTTDELADRAQAAYAARTVAEMDALLKDLPRRATPVDRRPARNRTRRTFGCWCGC